MLFCFEHVVFWVELLIQRRLYPIFVKLWVLIKGTNSVVSGYPTSTSFSWVDSWSMDPWVLGCHMYFVKD